MKILVVSDTHGSNLILDELYKEYPNCDLYLHLGDSEADELSIIPFTSVRGNCDYNGDFPDSLTFPLPCGGFLLATHAPCYSINELKAKDVKIYLHGHTHIRKNETIAGVTILNPGSISRPRDEHRGSYLLIEASKEGFEVQFHTIYEKLFKK